MYLTEKEGKCAVCGKEFETYPVDKSFYEERQEYYKTVYYPEDDAQVTQINGVGGYICITCVGDAGHVIRKEVNEHIQKDIHYLNRQIDGLEEKYRKRLEDEKALLEDSLKTYKEVQEIVNSTPRLDRGRLNSIEALNYGIQSVKDSINSLLKWEDIYLDGKMEVRKFNKEYGIEIDRYPQGIHDLTMVTRGAYLDLLLDCIVKNKPTMGVMNLIETAKSKLEVR